LKGKTGSSNGANIGRSSGSTDPRTGGKVRHLVTNTIGMSAIFGPFTAKINNMKVAEAITAAGSDPPSSVTQGGEISPMCCVWHLKGQCWAKCTRALISEDEDNKLFLAWCEKAST
jgi:hypothetical protein